LSPGHDPLLAAMYPTLAGHSDVFMLHEVSVQAIRSD
jgi:hypothetical protein